MFTYKALIKKWATTNEKFAEIWRVLKEASI